MNNENLPGSQGEHTLQDKYNSKETAKSFYDRELYDHMTQEMQQFLLQQKMMFISTADANGECDSSFRAGEAGFVHFLDKHKLIYPEFKGNGVMASLGNISENGHIGLLFIDFFETQAGLHINGKAKIVDTEELKRTLTTPEYEEVIHLHKKLSQQEVTWVIIEVEEAYIHCSKNIPKLVSHRVL